MAGYKGMAMSWNAVKAYENGEMPFSKWTKKNIVDEIKNRRNDINIDLIKKLDVESLKATFLRKSSWHHTGEFFNQTDFYEIDEEKIENLSNEKVASWIENDKKDKELFKKFKEEEKEKEESKFIILNGSAQKIIQKRLIV